MGMTVPGCPESGGQRAQDIFGAEFRAGLLENGYDMPPQSAGVIVTTVQ